MKKAIWLIPIFLFIFGLLAGRAVSLKQHPSRQAASHKYIYSLIGKQCTVQFKRNALGGGGNIPVSPTTDNSDGANVSIWGTLTVVEDDAVVLESEDSGRTFWIPRESILLIEKR